MIRRKYKLIIAALSLLAMINTTSCLGDLDVTPIDPSVTQEFHQDEVFAKIYASLALTGQEGPAGLGDLDGIDEGFSAFYRLVFTVNEYSSDEAICAWNDDGIPEMNFIRWGSSHTMLEGLYNRLFFGVTLSNHFLEMTDGAGDDKTVKQRAEARFLRALNYFYLMDIFGNVPFTEVVSTSLPQQIKRADLYAYLVGELTAIEADMFDAKQAPYGRADKVACWLLLSRIYLNAEVYTGQAEWAKAAEVAKKVMDSSYTLAPVYQHLFMADNDGSGTVNGARAEIILPIRQDGVRTISFGGSTFLVAATHTEGMNYWGSTEGWGGIRARKALVEKFFPLGNAPMNADETVMPVAAKDDRALFYAGGDRTLEINNVNEFEEGFSVTKFTNVRADGGAVSHAKWVDTDIPFFRAAEAYLTFAEATLRGSGDAGQALNAVNELRKRANADELAAVTLDIILDEKAREFYFETQRRTDLIRYGYFTGNKYLWDWKGGAKEGTNVSSVYNLCPIPVSDMNANKNLEQNPGF